MGCISPTLIFRPDKTPKNPQHMLSQDDLYADIKRYNNDLALYLFKMTVSRIFHGFADGRTRSDAKITQQILKSAYSNIKNVLPSTHRNINSAPWHVSRPISNLKPLPRLPHD